MKNLFVDWSSTHPWRRPICWVLGHAQTWTHPGPYGSRDPKHPRYFTTLETCYRCGLTRSIGDPWPRIDWGTPW